MLSSTQILALNTVDLVNYEIRGAKTGINNATTTGPLYTGGTYYPADSTVTGSAYFSGALVTSISFDAPYGGLDASDFRIAGSSNAADIILSDGTEFSITKILSPSSVNVDQSALAPRFFPVIYKLGQREYLVEPDSRHNTVSTGTATFTQYGTAVTGSGTSWATDLTSGDFIKHDGYQQFFPIQNVIDNNNLILTSAYGGDTTIGSYTAKRVAIGRVLTQYTKNDFSYNKETAYWTYDSTTDSSMSTSLSFSPYVDGIELKFSKASVNTAPDLMDVAVVRNKIFARRTQYDTFQFPLPVVPYPESTMELFINYLKKDMYPSGNRDYVLNYSQNPIYMLPPAPEDRKVTNIMFLGHVTNVQPSTTKTESGSISFTDSVGNALSEIMPGSEKVYLDGTQQTRYRDYVLEPNSGTAVISDSTIGEPLVKYVASNVGRYINYGISFQLNGVPQRYSIPAKSTDQVLFQPATGRFKPSNKDYPGPGDTYEVHYQVEGTAIDEESVNIIADQTSFFTSLFPVRRNSVILSKDGIILDEETDFHLSYSTGAVFLSEPLTGAEALTVSYTPLSLQVNGLSRSDKTSYCTTYDSRLRIEKAVDFDFRLTNLALDASRLSVLRVYNETRSNDYDITDVYTSGNTVQLQKNVTNIAVGCDSSDIVLMDYKFISENVEYKPAIINNFVIAADSSVVYIENQNIPALFPAGSIMILNQPDAAIAYYSIIDFSGFNGADTKVTLKTPILDELNNPGIYVCDASVSFNPVPYISNPGVSGESTVSFLGPNIKNIFRPGTLLSIDNYIYGVSGATFNTDDMGVTFTSVSLASSIRNDFTSTTVYYSDCPVYLEGATELIPREPVITLINQPGLILSSVSNTTHDIAFDASNLYIDASSFPYNTGTLGGIESGIQAAFSDIRVLTYIPSWRSDKFIPQEGLSIFKDSSTVLYMAPALNIDGTDSTSFGISGSGSIVLDTGVSYGQRCFLDYQGQQFLDSTQVSFSVDYFTKLSKGSRVEASFQYINLDQFYIQVMSQKDFYQTVTIPRARAEVAQLSGNVGQGGEVSGDEDEGNSSGGLTNDEYRRKDAEIECRVFKNIYDFFSNRLVSFGNEMLAATGLKLLNNDGTFSETQQQTATKVVNRIFPYTDYTNNEAYKANPITGEFNNYWTIFTQGQTGVSNIGSSYGAPSFWTQQFPVDGTGYIGRADSTKRYKISSVVSDSSISLTTSFKERTTVNPETERYAGSTAYPIYDDDGFLGAKIIGTRNSNFGLADGDIFRIRLDSSNSVYRFQNSLDPYLALRFPVSKLSITDIAEQLSTMPGLSATAEPILDPTTSFGYNTALVLRTGPGVNYMKIGVGNAVSKLGFVTNTEARGNLDRTEYEPENHMIILEQYSINYENGYLVSLIADGVPNKLNRLTNLIKAFSVYSGVSAEIPIIERELLRLETEIEALSNIITEPSLSSYADSSVAYTNALIAQQEALVAQTYDNNIVPTWEGKLQASSWVMDIDSSTQYIRGLQSGIGVPDSTGLGIVSINGATSFYLQATGGYDIRILDTTSGSFISSPVLKYEDDNFLVDGSWTGWNVYGYSSNNKAQFHFNDTTSVFSMRYNPVSPTASYAVDRTAINIYLSSGPSFTYRYADYLTVGLLKAGIDSISGMDVTGPLWFDSSASASLRLASGAINPDATVFPALRDCYVAYQTISDRLLNNRLSFEVSRDLELGNRHSYLTNVRELGIKTGLVREALLRGSDGLPGDLYGWADNRFNRRQGCEARLNQATQMMGSNKSALTVNQRLL